SVEHAEQRASQAEERARAAELAAAAEIEATSSAPKPSPRPAPPDNPHPPDSVAEAPAAEPDEPQEKEERPPGEEVPGEVAPSVPDGPAIDLNDVSFDELRSLNLTVTQATRVLAYRDQRNRDASV